MYVACHNGHLNVAKWLYEAGAVEDVCLASSGITPLTAACKNSEYKTMTWLVLKGAANNVLGPWSGHVSAPCMARQIGKPQARSALACSLHEIVDLHTTFTAVLLPGMYCEEFSNLKGLSGQELLTVPPLCMLRGHESTIAQHIADFLGVQRGRELRNAREATAWVVQ